jgi:hypothetical protein
MFLCQLDLLLEKKIILGTSTSSYNIMSTILTAIIVFGSEYFEKIEDYVLLNS